MHRASALAIGLLAAATTLAAPASGAEQEDRGRAAASGESKLLRAEMRLEPFARHQFPDSFAGSWLGTGKDDAGKVFVAFTNDATRDAKSLRDRLPKSDRGRLRVVTFKHSLRQLELIQLRMISDRELARRGALRFPDVPGGAYDLDIDVTENRPVVTVENETEAAADAFEARYGPSVVVEEGPLLEPDVCTREDCGPSIRGGLRTIGFLSGEKISCSTAFTVRERVRAHARVGVLSAAHCGGGPGAARHHRIYGNLQPYGAVIDEEQAGEVDAEWHSVNKPFSAVNACVYVPSPYLKQCAYVYKVRRKLDELPIGLELCKSGWRTGVSCGHVLSKSASPTKYVPGAQKFVKTDFCSEKGDSGGAVYFRGIRGSINAHGILSGGLDDYPCGDSRDRTVFGHLEFVERQLPVRVISSDMLK